MSDTPDDTTAEDEAAAAEHAEANAASQQYQDQADAADDE